MKNWERQEARQAKQHGGRRQPGSGNKWGRPGDIIAGDYLIECKTKEKPSKSFTVKKEWLEKNKQEAFLLDKYPMLVFSFGDATDYVVMEAKQFWGLIED